MWLLPYLVHKALHIVSSGLPVKREEDVGIAYWVQQQTAKGNSNASEKQEQEIGLLRRYPELENPGCLFKLLAKQNKLYLDQLQVKRDTFYIPRNKTPNPNRYYHVSISEVSEKNRLRHPSPIHLIQQINIESY